MKTRSLLKTAAVLLAASVALPATAQNEASLIARDLLFGHPVKASPKISPDGSLISYLAPVNGILNVHVASTADPELGRPVTTDASAGIRVYQWAHTSKHILFLRDPDGDGSAQLMCVDVSNGRETELTPATADDAGSPHAVSARIQHISHRYPRDVVVGLNIRDRRWHDLYVINLDTGERVELQRNEGFIRFATDDDYSVRMAMRTLPDGGLDVLAMDDQGEWAPFTQIPPEDVPHTGPIGFDQGGNTVYMIDSRGRDTAALKSIDLATGRAKTLAKDRDADISGGVLIHPTERTVQAASSTHQRRTWHVVDKSVKSDFKYLATVSDGELSILSRSQDDAQWIVAYESDRGPVRYYRYDRTTQTALYMFPNRPEIEGLPFAPMYSDTVKARDRQQLVSYYTLPRHTDPRGRGRPSEPLPMVVWVHGGPWWRDTWGFDPVHQWLANRGYAVLSVNYRGSSGLGKKFMNAGDREWGGKMQEDLADAVAWAVKKQIADPDRVAVMGGSYGGYAAMMALCTTPDQYACAININGPVDLVRFIESLPTDWAPAVDMWATRVGDVRTEEGRSFLRERSPVSCASEITRPVLLASGMMDSRVEVADTQVVVDTLTQNGVPVTWLVYPDEGHGLARTENRLAFFAIAESFLGRHLGGRVQPIGTDLDDSSVEIPVGGNDLAAFVGP